MIKHYTTQFNNHESYELLSSRVQLKFSEMKTNPNEYRNLLNCFNNSEVKMYNNNYVLIFATEIKKISLNFEFWIAMSRVRKLCGLCLQNKQTQVFFIYFTVITSSKYFKYRTGTSTPYNSSFLLCHLIMFQLY